MAMRDTGHDVRQCAMSLAEVEQIAEELVAEGLAERRVNAQRRSGVSDIATARGGWYPPAGGKRQGTCCWRLRPPSLTRPPGG